MLWASATFTVKAVDSVGVPASQIRRALPRFSIQELLFLPLPTVPLPCLNRAAETSPRQRVRERRASLPSGWSSDIPAIAFLLLSAARHSSDYTGIWGLGSGHIFEFFPLHLPRNPSSFCSLIAPLIIVWLLLQAQEKLPFLLLSRCGFIWCFPSMISNMFSFPSPPFSPGLFSHSHYP